MTTIGHIEEFDSTSDDINDWLERLNFFFEANGVEEAKKQKAVFLSVCGKNAYSLLKNILLPAKVADKKYEELAEALKNHCAPTRSVTIERFNFYSSRQTAGESISDFIAKLKCNSRNCEFGDTVNLMLRDLLVVGTRHAAIQKRLLAEKDLTFARATELALAMESAENNQNVIGSASIQTANNTTDGEHINKISPQQCRHGNSSNLNRKSIKNRQLKNEKKPCYRCDGQHSPDSCRYKESQCTFCSKKGHIEQACMQKKRQNKFQQTNFVPHDYSEQEPCNSSCSCFEDEFEEDDYEELNKIEMVVDIERNSDSACETINHSKVQKAKMSSDPLLTYVSING